MTTIPRTMPRTSAGPLIAVLGLAAAFGAGLAIGGPVLHLAANPTIVSGHLSAAVVESGRRWELQRIEQTPRSASTSVVNPATIAGGEAWERERQQEAGGR